MSNRRGPRGRGWEREPRKARKARALRALRALRRRAWGRGAEAQEPAKWKVCLGLAGSCTLGLRAGRQVSSDVKGTHPTFNPVLSAAQTTISGAEAPSGCLGPALAQAAVGSSTVAGVT